MPIDTLTSAKKDYLDRGKLAPVVGKICLVMTEQLFKEDIQIKVLIYSSIIRQILTTYLADPAYKNCQKKEKFIEKVISNSGLQNEIPNYFREDGKVNEEATDWIEEVTAGCINMPIIKAGKRTRYLEEFKKIIGNNYSKVTTLHESFNAYPNTNHRISQYSIIAVKQF